jgi:hypothetical protein
MSRTDRRNIVRKLANILKMIVIVAGMFGAVEAQQKQPPSQLKILVVFTEFDGDKKVANLPYSFTAVGGDDRDYEASIRLGISIPIVVQDKGEAQTQYQDVGTNIDCRARRLDDGRYKLTFAIERSSVHSPDSSSKGAIPTTSNPLLPLLRRYRGTFDLLLRDGQTAEGPVATDPQSGRILKTEVKLEVTR